MGGSRIVLAIAILVAICSSPAVATTTTTTTTTTTGPPIYIGTFTSNTASDTVTRNAISPVFDAYEAAFSTVNSSGGINGRPLVLVKCEAALDADTMLLCAKNFSVQHPSMVSWIGVMTDHLFSILGDEFRRQDMFYTAPIFQSANLRTNYFTRDWIFTNVEPHVQFMNSAVNFVQKYHVRRVGFVYEVADDANDFDTQGGLSLLTQLGVEFTGTISVNSGYQDGYKWRTDEYFNWLNLMPQTIFLFCTPRQATFEVFTDLLTRSASGNVSRDLMIIAPDVLTPVAELAFQLHLFANVKYDPKGRVFFLHSNPVLTDSTYLAMQRAKAELTSFWEGKTSFLNSATYVTTAALGWIGAQVLMSILRSMDATNITKYSIKDHVFSSGLFEVDDLLFGVYSKPCSGARAILDQFCSCNEGYRTAEAYGYDSTVVGKLVKIPELVLTYPVTRCHTQLVAVTPHLVYLVLVNVDNSTSASARLASALLEAGQRQQELNANPPLTNRATYERLNLTGLDEVAAAASIGGRCADRYVSALFGSVVEKSALNVSGYPLIDPLVFPARLTPPYAYNVLYLSATLEQEVFVLAQRCVTDLKMTMSVVARGDEAEQIAQTMKKSIESFSSQLGGCLTISSLKTPFPWSAYTLPQQPSVGGNFLFVSGLVDSADVDALLQFLSKQPKVIAAVPFSELSVLYNSFLACAQTAPRPTCSQVVFATSLRNWNAPQLANHSGLMVDYFAAFNGSAGSPPRHPLTLRGFVNSVAIRRVTAEISAAYLPDAILQKWYSIGLIVLSTFDYVGAFTSTVCSAGAVSGDSLCEVNAGARVIRVMSLEDVAVGNSTSTTSSSDSLLTVTFSSASIPYRSITKEEPWTISRALLAGIILGSVALTAALVAGFVYLRSRARNNARAPRDPTKPITLLFTDIESSTALWAHAPEAMAKALETHHALLRSLLDKYDCYEVKTIGDAFMVASTDPLNALRFCCACQRQLLEENWPSEIGEVYRLIDAEKGHREDRLSLTSAWRGLRVRIGVHTGLPEIKHDEVTKGYDYYGSATNIAARVESTADGGQVLLSRDCLTALDAQTEGKWTRELSVTVRSIGPVQLKGVDGETELFDVGIVEGRSFVEMPKQFLAASAAAVVENCVSEEASIRQSFGNSPRSPVFKLKDSNKLLHVQHDWTTVAERMLVIMLSASPKDRQKAILSEFCERFHLHVDSSPTQQFLLGRSACFASHPGRAQIGALNELNQSVASSRDGHPPSQQQQELPLECDPHLRALVERFAPMLKTTFGQM